MVTFESMYNLREMHFRKATCIITKQNSFPGASPPTDWQIPQSVSSTAFTSAFKTLSS